MSNPQASEWMKDAVCDFGTPVSVCGFCGVTHYADDTDMDEGEFDDLEAKSKAHPDKYRHYGNCDSVSRGEIEGVNYVWGCGCEKSEARLWKIEMFLWGNQVMIDRYYRNRITAMKEEAATRERMLQR